ncbi:MAG TPA: tyrosine-protein phosphatase [Ilumatobacteraceae bacterium]|nr:tyrosine-protein phosphatase [Ilumatobacteraceae bacterium]
MSVGTVDRIADDAVVESPAPTRRMSWRSARRVLLRFVIVVAVANVVIMLLSWVVSVVTELPRPTGVDAVGKLYVVDPQVWRGAHPDDDGYASLAAAGVTTVVDLRAERDAYDSDRIAEALGLSVVHLPIRDGQVPSDAQVARFVGIVHDSRGTVFLHCGAGVGRTGAMAAAYLAATGQASGGSALMRNLAVGPPSVEQMWYAVTDGAGPPPAVVALSRVLDAPRRLLSYI